MITALSPATTNVTPLQAPGAPPAGVIESARLGDPGGGVAGGPAGQAYAAGRTINRPQPLAPLAGILIGAVVGGFVSGTTSFLWNRFFGRRR